MFEKILVAIDLDPESAKTVLDRVQTVSGQGSPAEIWAIHVVEPQFVQYSIDPTFTGSLTQSMEQNAIDTARTRLAEVCTPYGIPADHQLVSIGPAADHIHRAATDKGVDSIIIGSHIRKGLARLLGSTANAVLHGSPVNVMTVRIGS